MREKTREINKAYVILKHLDTDELSNDELKQLLRDSESVKDEYIETALAKYRGAEKMIADLEEDDDLFLEDEDLSP